MSEFDDGDLGPECVKCYSTVRVRPGSDWEQGKSVCDPCAQESLAQLETQLAEAQAQNDELVERVAAWERNSLAKAQGEDMAARCAKLEVECQELEAQCAATREALDELQDCYLDGLRLSAGEHNALMLKVDAALAPNAGRELLERLQAAERERDYFQRIAGLMRDVDGEVRAARADERLRLARLIADRVPCVHPDPCVRCQVLELIRDEGER